MMSHRYVHFILYAFAQEADGFLLVLPVEAYNVIASTVSIEGSEQKKV